MPHIRSAGTTGCLAEMLHTNHRHLGAEALATGAEALAYICDTEDFVTYRVRMKAVDGLYIGEVEEGPTTGSGGGGRGGFPPRYCTPSRRAEMFCFVVDGLGENRTKIHDVSKIIPSCPVKVVVFKDGRRCTIATTDLRAVLAGSAFGAVFCNACALRSWLVASSIAEKGIC